ncbi:MAG: DUF5665 domain-containing protein [Bacillota bacterium]
MLNGFHKLRLKRIEERLENLVSSLEKARFHEYLEYIANRKRMLWTNFLMGLARGIGMAIGFTLLGALVIYILRQIAASSLPVLGDFIAKLMDIVESKR